RDEAGLDQALADLLPHGEVIGANPGESAVVAVPARHETELHRGGCRSPARPACRRRPEGCGRRLSRACDPSRREWCRAIRRTEAASLLPQRAATRRPPALVRPRGESAEARTEAAPTASERSRRAPAAAAVRWPAPPTLRLVAAHHAV